MSNLKVNININEMISIDTKLSKSELTEDVVRDLLIKELAKKLPRYSYTIDGADTLTFENVYSGQIVKLKGEIGVVLKVNKKTINVATKNNVHQGHPSFFTQADSVKPDDVVWKNKHNFYVEGQTGYFVNYDDIIPVVLAKSRDNFHLLIIGTNKYFKSMRESQLDESFFYTKKEAENSIK